MRAACAGLGVAFPTSLFGIIRQAVDGLAGAETVTINVQSDSGYVAFNSTDGFANGTTGITLTATAPAFTIRAPGKYQAVLSTTVGNTSVHMVSEAHQ